VAKGGTIFKSLKINGWRQFQSIDIDFHPRLTVITGTNGAGKSTILNILSMHVGISRQYYALPHRRGNILSYLPGIFNIPKKLFKWIVPDRTPFQQYLGEISYSNDITSKIVIPTSPGLAYDVTLENQQNIVGFHMPSHRLLPHYQPVANLSFSGIEPNVSFQMLIGETYSGFRGQNTGNSLLYQLKQILASWAAIGEGNSSLRPRSNQLAAYNGFIDVLRRVIPKEIGFQGIEIEPPDILVKTDTGTFIIDSCSGGLLTMIEIAALIYTCSLRDDVTGKRFVVTFDEPENHLHPSLQRSLLPTLVNTFPDVQFIVATHSPFVVSSLKDSSVYVLRYMDSEKSLSGQDLIPIANRRIESLKLESFDRSGNASEILREVLGVTVTFPQWVEADLETIVKKYQNSALTEEVIKAIKSDIDKAGLEEMFSEALTLIGERK